MADQKLRSLQREATQGDLQAQAALLAEQIRQGLITESRVRLNGLCGHPASRLLLALDRCRGYDGVYHSTGCCGPLSLEDWLIATSELEEPEVRDLWLGFAWGQPGYDKIKNIPSFDLRAMNISDGLGLIRIRFAVTSSALYTTDEYWVRSAPSIRRDRDLLNHYLRRNIIPWGLPKWTP